MASAPSQKPRLIAALVLLVAAAACVIFIPKWRTAEPARPEKNVLVYETPKYRYEFHLVTGGEALFEKCEGPRALVDVSKEVPEATRECRRALEKELDVPDLEKLRKADEDEEIRAKLKALGYL
jgi:hypothetical protein